MQYCILTRPLLSPQVPITLFLMTHAYFALYHSLANVLIRYARALTRSKGSTYQCLAEAAVIFVLAYATAYGETLTIAHYPHYKFTVRSGSDLRGVLRRNELLL